MITVEEAITARHVSSGFMIQHRQMLAADAIMFPRGVDDVLQLALSMGNVPLYTWATPIKRTVDQVSLDFPLDQAVQALHHFHQPCMFWLFDDPVMFIVEPASQRDKVRVPSPQAVDAILVMPTVKGPSRTARQIVTDLVEFQTASDEERARHDQEVVTKATGVQITAFSSLRSGVVTPLPIGTAPVGSRIAVPIMVAQVEFGRSWTDLDVVDEQLTDPTIHQEQIRIKQWVLAAAALLKQRILVAESQLATRAERKRLARQELETSVMTIQLRATEHAATTTPAGMVEWSHRWIVRGHWRQQWYPSQQEHCVLWIPPYVKGPDDRPLQVRPAVYAVTR